ncbi:hypothetical protein RHGRI_028146 [Rhododendron griersonianum]|uniref:F-box domain-containing protein n=1 Tax=Rhododendron griersonianum TaxID=479676 RepID=A0AAV6IEL6_9ERIC|nr:hypothetical protein RHGRI_028146 [Rhododendron griersonianum]
MTTTNNHLKRQKGTMLTEEEKISSYKFMEPFTEKAPAQNNDAVVASMDLFPDRILSDIISLLTIRDAVRTSTRILTFRVSLCVGREFSYETGQWISLAVRLGVESLQLHFSCNPFLFEAAAAKPVECKHKEYYIFPCHLLPPSEESMLKHLFLQSSRNLEKLQLLVEYNRSLGYLFSQLGKVVPHVKALSVISPTDWIERIPECLLTFTKVKKLELYFYKRTVFHIPNIFAVLEACPLLQNFHLMVSIIVLLF